MDENNIDKLIKQIEDLQNAYDRDVENGVLETDKIQENRKNKIEELSEELKNEELKKLDILKSRKKEIEEKLDKKENLEKDREQLEKEMNEIPEKDKSKVYQELENNYIEISREISGIEDSEKELKDINKEINEICKKYNISIDEKKKLNEDPENPGYDLDGNLIGFGQNYNIDENEQEQEEKTFKQIEKNLNNNIENMINNENNINNSIEENPGYDEYGDPIGFGHNYEEQSLAVIPERRGLFSWIKEKFSKIKNFFIKEKKEEVELDETGQAWQDYIDSQDDISNNNKSTKRKRFLSLITQNDKLNSKENQKKQFELARKLAKENSIEVQKEQEEQEKE